MGKMGNYDLDAIMATLRSKPTDQLAIQALADWLEERGAAVGPVRNLAVSDGDVVVIGQPANDHLIPDPESGLPYDQSQFLPVSQYIVRVLSRHFNSIGKKDVLVISMPADMTIRQIRTSGVAENHNDA
jgi:hypothetical protein